MSAHPSASQEFDGYHLIRFLGRGGFGEVWLCRSEAMGGYGTHMLEGGASVRQVAAYLGHSTLKEVMRYLHLTEISESNR